MALIDMSGTRDSYRKDSDSPQHDQRESQQVDILLQFIKSSRSYCVCVVDIVGSTEKTMGLDNEKIGKYYGLFLNTMAETASSYGAVVVKNVGDSLLYYFPGTDSCSEESFRNVLRCSFAMIAARDVVNRSMRREGLPDVSYRLSCEFGAVAVARVSTSSVNDIFGTAVNMAAKINSLAPANTLVIGSRFYEHAKKLRGYSFSMLENTRGLSSDYQVYVVSETAGAP